MAAGARVLVDSSVWVDFLRGDKDAAQVLRFLARNRRVVLCGQIRQEVLQGSRNEKAFNRLEKELQIWEYEAEEPDDFLEAARIFARLRWKGVTIPLADCLVAAVAIRRKLQLYARDEDFNRIPNLQLFDPRGVKT